MFIIKYLLYRLKWYFAYIINFQAPVHVDIEMTSACHLDCIMCFRNDIEIKARNLNKNLAKLIIDDCVKLGVKSIKFNWRGEALLNYNTCYMIGYAKQNGLVTYLNTSLSCNLNQYQLLLLAEHTDVFKVSIDSIKVYDDIRQNGNFEIVMENLERIVKYRKSNSKKKVIISRRQIEIDGFETDREFKNFFKEKGWAVKFDIRPAIKRNKNDIFSRWLELDLGRRYCGHPSRRLVIGADGSVFMCCVAYGENSELFLGDINHNSLENMWLSKKRRDLIFKLKNNKYEGICDKCTSKDSYK